MARYICSVCGYEHDESKEGARWDDLPDDWTCPVCGAAKSQFAPAGESGSPAAATTGSPLRRAALTHRVFGYAFLALYIVLAIQMAPRLWTYQIEFPARTVLHIGLGMALGAMLLVKIGIVRLFPKLDQALVPLLGTGILVGSVVLIGVSIPFALQEALATGAVFRAENRQRVETQLTQAGLTSSQSAELASPASLQAGQRVLRSQCIECHDLRTVLARPRTASNWRQTVRRMADRTTSLNPLEETEQWRVTAYLVAISPQLQRSTQQLRDAQEQREEAVETSEAIAAGGGSDVPYDAAAARQLFDAKCAQCHGTSLVNDVPPESEPAARQLVAAMVEEGLEASDSELEQIVLYLVATYVQPSE